MSKLARTLGGGGNIHMKVMEGALGDSTGKGSGVFVVLYSSYLSIPSIAENTWYLMHSTLNCQWNEQTKACSRCTAL